MQCATPNSGPRAWKRKLRPRGVRASKGLRTSVLVLIAIAACALADIHEAAREAAKKVYTAAREAYLPVPTNTVLAANFARASFDLAEFATNNAERALLAEQGIEACRKTLRSGTNTAALQYYLGMNLGQLARTRGLGALRLVDEMEGAFKKARELDEHFDFAGPDRNLGLLYRDAPSIASVGSRSKARNQLERAVKLEPDYPDNRLSLLEGYLNWKDKAAARRELAALEALWPKAQTNFSAQKWAVSWLDWESRLHAAAGKLGQPAKVLRSPKLDN